MATLILLGELMSIRLALRNGYVIAWVSWALFNTEHGWKVRLTFLAAAMLGLATALSEAGAISALVLIGSVGFGMLASTNYRGENISERVLHVLGAWTAFSSVSGALVLNLTKVLEANADPRIVSLLLASTTLVISLQVAMVIVSNLQQLEIMRNAKRKGKPVSYATAVLITWTTDLDTSTNNRLRKIQRWSVLAMAVALIGLAFR